jgi:predicted transcriptional regulator
MKRKNKKRITDLEECRDKIESLLREYNCELISADEWHQVLIRDNDTDETKGFKR